jgi:Family of unknown function (DUF6612)
LEGRKLFKGRSFVLILVLLAVLVLVGCGSSETKVNADEVVQDALAAQAGVDSSSMEITIDATVVGVVNDMDLNVSLDGTVTSDIDWVNKKMNAHLGMNAGFNGMTFPVSMDMYAFDNVSYMQLTMMGSTDNWTKASLPIDFWYTQENEQFIENLLEAADAESLPNDKVDGVNCYVLKLSPDYAALQQMLNQQADTGEEVPDIASLISSLSIKVWVAKDTSYVTKIEIVLAANIPSEVLGGAAGGQGLAVNLTVNMQSSDFNESVPIQLPAEAENAEWGNPLDMLSGFGF